MKSYEAVLSLGDEKLRFFGWIHKMFYIQISLFNMVIALGLQLMSGRWIGFSTFSAHTHDFEGKKGKIQIRQLKARTDKN